MMAVALCGTAFAFEKNTSALTENELSDFSSGAAFNEEEPVTLNVDATVTFQRFYTNYAGPLTLNFEGTNILQASTQMRPGSRANTLAVAGDTAALTYWGESLTSTADLNYVPLAIAVSPTTTTTYPNDSVYQVTFMGEGANTSISLGDSSLTYLGYLGGPSQTKLENTIGENQFAVVGLNRDGYKGLYLVGRGGATTPEPATATLSLLALAGLATRRRRK